MPKPFDATLKVMLEESPPDWPILLGRQPLEAEAVDADVSTRSGGADKVLRVRTSAGWYIQHVEFQAGPDATAPRRAHLYNAVAEDRHELPVSSAVVLLSPRAAHRNINGVYERGLSGEPAYLRFTYQVVRVWELPVERLLAGGVGTLSLAPISAVTEADLPRVIERMKERFARLQSRSDIGKMWTATYVLMGLRYQQPLLSGLLRGVMDMEESVTYQEIVAKGVAKGRREGELSFGRNTLLLQGEQRFGRPTKKIREAIAAINDTDQLQRLLVRQFEVSTWEELLGVPPRSPRRRRST